MSAVLSTDISHTVNQQRSQLCKKIKSLRLARMDDLHAVLMSASAGRYLLGFRQPFWRVRVLSVFFRLPS